MFVVVVVRWMHTAWALPPMLFHKLNKKRCACISPSIELHDHFKRWLGHVGLLSWRQTEVCRY